MEHPGRAPSEWRRKLPLVAGAVERILIVEARDLDTDERTVASFEVEIPTGEAAQRAQLSAVVAQLHPEARMRSFGNGAASFLDSQQLVVAHYGGTNDEPASDSRARQIGPVEQQPLFAA